EIALGNAVGSVICDDGIALALAAILAPTFIAINRRVWKAAAIFLSVIYICVYMFALNGTIARFEGAVLLVFLAGYFTFLILQELKNRNENIPIPGMSEIPTESELPEKTADASLARLFTIVILCLSGIVIASHFVVGSSVKLAQFMGVPEVIIGLTIIAIGTSLPEITTCIISARKGFGDIAVGNIIGADILNILWIIGASSVVNPIHVSSKEINFMFPAMIIVVATMLICMRIGYKIGTRTGLVLLGEYLIYIFLTIYLFY
ncbi:MAG: hypothetical protein A2161_17860, partial [Candidatus Schekmanbacteria bacterium RBG_13_48_7]